MVISKLKLTTNVSMGFYQNLIPFFSLYNPSLFLASFNLVFPLSLSNVTFISHLFLSQLSLHANRCGCTDQNAWRQDIWCDFRWHRWVTQSQLQSQLQLTVNDLTVYLSAHTARFMAPFRPVAWQRLSVLPITLFNCSKCPGEGIINLYQISHRLCYK